MLEQFNKQSRIVKIILLLIPFVNWVIELVIRWTNYFEKKETVHLVLAISTIVLGLFIGYVDLICLILTGKLFLIDASDSQFKKDENNQENNK